MVLWAESFLISKPDISHADDEPLYLRESNPLGPTLVAFDSDSVWVSLARKLHHATT